MRWKMLMLPQLHDGQLRIGVDGVVELDADGEAVVLGRNIAVIQPIMLSCRKAVGVVAVTGTIEAPPKCMEICTRISPVSQWYW